jgi:hypothetical protein
LGRLGPILGAAMPANHSPVGHEAEARYRAAKNREQEVGEIHV